MGLMYIYAIRLYAPVKQMKPFHWSASNDGQETTNQWLDI
jgi:hypothetical protein